MDPFPNFPKGPITLIKSDGTRVEAQARMSNGKLTVWDPNFPVETGDIIERRLPSGIVERYEVVDTGYSPGLGSIPAHYSIKVRNSALRTASPNVVHNYHAGQVGAQGPNAVASHNFMFQQVHHVDIGEVRTCFAEAKRAIGEMDLDQDTREVVDASIETLEKQLAKPEPKPRLLLPLATTIATALTTAGAVGQGVDYVTKLLALLQGVV